MSAPSVLLVTPYRRQQRGNFVTSQRLQKGLSQLGYAVDTVSLDSAEGWSEAAVHLSNHSYQVLHILHAAALEPVLERLPAAAELPLVLTTTGTDINSDLFGPLRKRIVKALKQAARVVVFNPAFISILSSSIPGIANKLRFIPQGVDLPDHPAWNRSRLQCGKDDIIAVLPSGIRPVKRIEWALEAMETVAVYHSGLRLLIAGPIIDRRYAPAILSHIDQLPHTAYLGEIDHEEMAGLYKVADMVLNTSIMEGQPQAALEGMSVGLPAIMSAVIGNLNIMTPDQEGYYVDSPQELAQAMLSLADSPSLRRQMGTAAASLIKEHYSTSAEWGQYRTLYQELIGQ